MTHPPITDEMVERATSFLATLEAYAGDANNTPEVCWLIPDDGENYCSECAEEQVNYFGNGSNVDGGWGGYEADCCIHCKSCGMMLGYSLTEAGIENELDHFASVNFDPLSKDDAARIVRMLEVAAENPSVIAVAERAVSAIPRAALEAIG